MILIAKTIMIIILGFDFTFNNNSHAIIPLFSFFFGSIIFYYCVLDNIFISEKDCKQLLIYYMSLIYMLSGLFVLIGYVAKGKFKNNFFIIFILFNVILILFAYIYVYRIKIIDFRDQSQFLSEYDIYLHTKNLLLSLHQKKFNRELMLNFLEYHSYHSNYIDKDLNDEDTKYNYYLIIEKSLKRRMLLFKKSIVLKLMHFLILKKYLNKNKSAYLLLYHLYSDIEKNIFSASFSQKFYIFRLKKSIEDDSIEFNYNKNEISIRFQINNLIDLIVKVSEMYYSFWNLLLSSIQSKEIKEINNIGRIIHILINEIEFKFSEIEKTKYKNYKLFLLYGYYLRDILNDKEKADKYLNKNYIPKIKEKKNYKNKNDFEENSDFQFIMISVKKNYSFIEKISNVFCINLGYFPHELIGKNINILFPDLLKEEYEIEFKKNLHNSNYKEEKKILFFKSKSKYLIIFPVKISLNYDEEHNSFLLIELIIEKFNVFNKNTKDLECHLITDLQCIINLYSSNSIYLLGFNSKYFNKTIDISNYIKEFRDEIFHFISTNNNFENITINYLKRGILKKKFLKKENEILWNINNKKFKIETNEIYINNKLLGYYFHLSHIIEKDDKGMTIIQNYNNNNLGLNLLPKLHNVSFSRAKTTRKISKDIIKESLIIEKFFIEDDFIPELEKGIIFDSKKKIYLFENKDKINNNNNCASYRNSIHSIKRRKIIFLKKQRKITFSNFSPDDSSSSNNSSSEDSENLTSSIVSLSNIISSEDENDIFKTITIKFDTIYFVNLKNIYLYIYDFNKKIPVEVKNNFNKSQIDIIIEKENNINENNTDKVLKKISLKAIIPEKKIEKKINKQEKKEEKVQKETFLNYFIIKWIIIIIINSICFIIISLFFFFFFLSLKKKIVQTINIHNSISDLMENSNKAYYYSYNLIILQNNLYNNFNSPKSDLIKNLKINLQEIYQNILLIHQNITIFSLSASKKINTQIDNYIIKLISIKKNLERNISFSNINNVIKEFSFSIYSFINLKNEEMKFSNIYFNFILSNYESLLSEDLQDFSNIFLDEYFNLKKRILIIIISSLIIFLIINLISFFFQYYIISKIYDEQKKVTDIFFKINPDYIINAIRNCENFIELNQKDKTNPEYLVSNPLINLSQNDVNESYNSNNDLENKCLLKKNIKIDFEIRKNSILKQNKNKICDKKIIDNFYMVAYIIFSLILFGILIYLSIFQIMKYNHSYNLSTLYTNTVNHKNHLIKYYNYLRTIIIYNSYRNEKNKIGEIYEIMKLNMNNTFKTNQDKFIEIFESMNPLNNKEKEKLNNIINEDICEYLNLNNTYYTISCDELGDGIGHYGLYATSIYTFQLIINLEMELENILFKGKKKGFLYNEVFYPSDIINQLYPNDTNLYNDYINLNPFLILNSYKYHNLNILVEDLIQNSFGYLSDFLKEKMINVINSTQNQIIFFHIIFELLIIFAIYFFFLPNILKKNDEIREEKNMLKIIPKNELEQILIKENIRI